MDELLAAQATAETQGFGLFAKVNRRSPPFAALWVHCHGAGVDPIPSDVAGPGRSQNSDQENSE
jgi:hypothetical protein